jgi:hypothetical protein
MTEHQKFMDIIEKYNFPTPIEDITGKTVDYFIDDHDTHVTIFTDNTCYFQWTSSYKEGMEVLEDYDDIWCEHGSLIFTLLKNKYPEAKKEWDEFNRELLKKKEELKREQRYNQYLSLKAEFEDK